MRKQIWIPCAVIVAICVLLLLYRNAKQQANNPSPTKVILTNQQPMKVVNQSTPPETFEKPKRNNVSNSGKAPRPSPADMPNLKQRVLADWQAPIEFYGKVVDENTNPVAGANIVFKWTETPSPDGNRTSTTTSDTEGLFSLNGARGPVLTVLVNKEGYYTSRSTPDSFHYALANEKFSPSPLNPVVFYLRKKEKGAELITSENGIRSSVWVRVPKDGTPVLVDFFQKRPSPTGQLEIKQVKPRWQSATNWSFSLSIPSGGLIENNDEFQFEAPAAGYQSTVEYSFLKGTTNWTTQVTKQFYITFDGKYGWLRFESDISQETVYVTYAINPTGSRNLEPK